MRLTCPWCGPRAIEEFVYGGTAAGRRPDLDDSPDAWAAYLYERDNPKGPHEEYWQHERGCRLWLIVERDTQTHAVAAVRLAEEPAP